MRENSSTGGKIRKTFRSVLFVVSPTFRMLEGNKHRMEALSKKVEGLEKSNELLAGAVLQVEERLKGKISAEDVIEAVSQMALSGDNTDKCLEKGFLPVRVHYYQPIPDIKDLEKRKVWDKVSKLSGIKFEPNKYLEFMRSLAEKYGKECDWPNDPKGDPEEFFLNNSNFSYGCAASLHCIIRNSKPKRIIEVGSGNSSKIIRDAIAVNERENGARVEYTIIDPYSNLDNLGFSRHANIVKKKVEEMNPDFFRRLEENDILFIDSSHVSKIGSDVNFEILEVLPILKKGVIIHFHDIGLPFEYSKTYATNPKFRMFWTEAYLLQAFLACNENFKIILPVHYIQNKFEKEFRKYFPKGDKAENFYSGSFWIKKIK